MSEKIKLDIPFSVKDDAKALGARWDKDDRVWYCMDDSENLQALQALEPKPFDKPIKKILPEIIPKTAWHANLRSEFTDESWIALRKHFSREYGYRCAITNTVGPNHPVELHDTWSFDDEKHIQKLEAFLPLSPAVHACMHPGYANVIERIDEVYKTMVEWNSKLEDNYTEATAKAEIAKAFEVWKARSEVEWEVDLSLLEDIPVEVVFEEKPEAEGKPQS